MFRERYTEPLSECREAPSARYRAQPQPVAYPSQPRWPVADRAPSPADVDPFRRDRATAFA